MQDNIILCKRFFIANIISNKICIFFLLNLLKAQSLCYFVVVVVYKHKFVEGRNLSLKSDNKAVKINLNSTKFSEENE